jgi:hypothetical protein
LKIASTFHQSRFFRRQEADYEFSGPFAYLKLHLSEFVKVALFDAQKAENDIALPLTL